LVLLLANGHHIFQFSDLVYNIAVGHFHSGRTLCSNVLRERRTDSAQTISVNDVSG
jgi:hypothetical protein